MEMKRTVVSTALAMMIMLLAGCAVAEETPGTGHAFSTVDALADAYSKHGDPCGVYKPIEDFPLAAQAVTCRDGVRLMTFATTVEQEEAVRVLKRDRKARFLVGANWIIVGDIAEEVSGPLDGVVVGPVSAPSPSPSAR
ncbi:hypothetical protein ACUOFU_04285 [Microbacterium arabinogalactanolyticum]|uniref:hypothetical protein n=1 Tax=Microbacterium arabinogalactanolyticum TaxID=69365 RepID=UPI004044A5AC